MVIGAFQSIRSGRTITSSYFLSEARLQSPLSLNVRCGLSCEADACKQSCFREECRVMCPLGGANCTQEAKESSADMKCDRNVCEQQCLFG